MSWEELNERADSAWTADRRTSKLVFIIIQGNLDLRSMLMEVKLG